MIPGIEVVGYMLEYAEEKEVFMSQEATEGQVNF